MSRLPSALLLGCVLVVTPFLAADDKPAAKDDKAKPPSVVGKFDVEGEDVSGAAYTGAVTIKKTGDAYAVEWTVGEDTFIGVGVLTDRTLSVAWANRRQVGVMVYTVEKGGTLLGKWSILGDPKGRVMKEKLTRKVT
jgi:hypothetical protein